LVLLLLTGAIHVWLMWHTEVLARDGIGYIHYAWRLQREPWPEVMRSSYQHPGYPLAIGATWRAAEVCGLHHCGHSPRALCKQMVFSAQLVNLMAGCLLAIVMFYLGKELFDRRVGFWTAAVFQCLPVAARTMSDALSETTFLLAVTVTLLLAVRSLRDYSVWRLCLCGVCGGCSFLIRPEGGITVLAVAATVLAMQALPRRRRRWRTVLLASASLVMGTALVAGPYVGVLGHLTNKPTGQAVIGVACEDAAKNSSSIPHSAFCIPHSSILDPQSSIFYPPMACLWGVGWLDNREADWLERLAWGSWAITEEVVRGFGYVAWLPALVGLYWYRGRGRMRPETWLLGLLCLFQALLLFRVVLVVGYASERHVLIIVLCGLYWAVWATLGSFGSFNPEPAATAPAAVRGRRWLPVKRLFPHSALLIFMLACLPVSLQPLHANQVGHREAGLWLAQHTQPSDIIVDPFDWAHFYAGRVFQGPPGDVPSCQRPMRYVVLEKVRKPHPELIMLPLAEKLAADGQMVFDWQPDRHQLEHKAQEVQIFAVPIP
jgi:hypothetical protein